MTFREKLDPQGIETLSDFTLFTAYAISEMKYDLHLTHSSAPKYKKIWAARELDQRSLQDSTRFYREIGMLKPDEDMDYEIDVLSKSISILELTGHTKTAQQLAKVSRRFEIAKRMGDTLLETLVDGAIKKNRSEAASGHRHHLHDEIVIIIKATWEKNPALSKKKMIAKLMKRYEDRVDEGTIKSWIKKEHLSPPVPDKYRNSDLVIPPEFL